MIDEAQTITNKKHKAPPKVEVSDIKFPSAATKLANDRKRTKLLLIIVFLLVIIMVTITIMIFIMYRDLSNQITQGTHSQASKEVGTGSDVANDKNNLNISPEPLPSVTLPPRPIIQMLDLSTSNNLKDIENDLNQIITADLNHLWSELKKADAEVTHIVTVD